MSVENAEWQKAKGHKIFRPGDKMRVRLNGKKTTTLVTFKRHVIPDKGSEYLEVIIARTGNWRYVSPDAFVGSGK